MKSQSSRLRFSAGLRRYGTSYLMIAPFVLIYLLFVVLPVLVSIGLSFTYFNMLEPPRFIFLENYQRLFFADDIFLKAVGNTVLFAVITGPLSYLLSMLFAWFINELRPKVRALVTLVFYAPSITGNMYLIWQVLFSGDSYGYVNGLLLNLGIISEPKLWLKDPEYMMPIICLVVLWTSLGTSFLSFIAGFQGIDKTYYEAAAVDGITNRWQELWFVTLPLIKPQMMFGAVMNITSSFGIGAVITQMVGFPSTDYAVHTIQNHMDDYGSTRFELGYASAIATILFVLMICSNLVVKRLISKVGDQS